jgi:sarcosine oxidase, subunit beta
MKILVCRCEDVLAGEVEAAIDSGHTDIESLKRYTGLGTGVCQGKSCVAVVAGILHQRCQLPPERIQPITPRPPIAPLPLSLLAGEDAK